MEFVCNNLKDFYKKVGHHLLEKGKKNCPRGLETKELIAPKIVLENAKENLVYNEKRQFSFLYALVEHLMLFSENKLLKYFSTYNKNIEQFSDDGITLYGNYGSRLNAFNSIDKVIEILKKDKDSRQAVLSIYNNVDNKVYTKDLPCTLSLQFLIRDNKLICICNMRSNDIIWGIPYDIFMFTCLQQVIANSLGIECGKYIHQPGSLHVYEKHYDTLKELAYGDTISYNYEVKEDLYRIKIVVDKYIEHIRGNQAKNSIVSLFTYEDWYKVGNLNINCISYDMLQFIKKYKVFFKRWELDI